MLNPVFFRKKIIFFRLKYLEMCKEFVIKIKSMFVYIYVHIFFFNVVFHKNNYNYFILNFFKFAVTYKCGLYIKKFNKPKF